MVTTADGLEAARAEVESVLRVFDLSCSRFRDDSELSALNHSAGRWVEVGDVLLEALQAAIWAAAITGGAVDPTVGHALRVAGYDRDFTALAPDCGPLWLRTEPVPGWRAIEVDRPGRRARLGSGVEVDLGSTAKALAADRCAWRALGVVGAGGVLVSLGGDIALAGEPPAGGWPILVAEDESAPLDGPGALVLLQEGGIATSSTTIRQWRRGGVLLHHIIDPATGRPAEGPWRAATVAADTCLGANTAATAAIVMGRSAPGWLERRGLPSWLVDSGGGGLAVGGWPEPNR